MPLLNSERKLTERVKELACLYAVARIAQKQDTSLSELIDGIVTIIPQGFQFPDIAEAIVRFDDRVFGKETDSHEPVSYTHLRAHETVLRYRMPSSA